MRLLLLAAAAVAATMAFASPGTADQTPAPSEVATSLPTFDDCFRLATVRGVHVERNELDEFNELCLAGKVPFETGNPTDSVKRGSP
jgi:ABC-type sugar transport system substrate-binding protein